MKYHILLVEDDLSTRLALASWIEHAGYVVTQAADGETAVELMETNLYRVVLTDIVMGDVDGIEVLHTARLQPYRPSVILLTGHSSVDTAIAAIRAGAFDYLQKPCNEDELLKCLEGAVKQQRSEQEMRNAATILYRSLSSKLGNDESTAPIEQQPTKRLAVRMGQLSIGGSRKEVTFAGKQVHLTPIEYSLICYLSEHRDTVQTYSNIVKHTHGLTTNNTDAQDLLRTHFRNLRKKISSHYFVTDRGTGYMLTAPNDE